MADAPRPTLFARLAGFVRFLFWGLLLWVLAAQFFGSNKLQVARDQALNAFQTERKSRVIALIHRQDSVSVLGVPVANYISIDDSEAILRAIRNTPSEQPIDMILHTPGGLVLAAEQIARALVERKGKVTVFVPHYAMSGGTLLALAADEIVMDPFAVLGPVDPQLGSTPAASIVNVVERKPIERVNDETLILADVARKARAQVQAFVTDILTEHGLAADRAAETAKVLSDGRFTHDYPITVKMAREIGLKVTTEMPAQVFAIMELYPQSGSRRPSVIYVDPPAPGREGGGKRMGPTREGGSAPQQ